MRAIHLKSLWMKELSSLFGALFVTLVSTSLLILAAAIFGLLIPVGTQISEVIAYQTYNLAVAFGCYFLCMKNPPDIWFVPLICNTTGIITAQIEPGFWTKQMSVLIISGWMISLIASIWGYDNGIRYRKRETYKR